MYPEFFFFFFLSWPGLPPGNNNHHHTALTEPVLLPSPASPSAVIVSPETLSHHSSPARKQGSNRSRTESCRRDSSSVRSNTGPTHHVMSPYMYPAGHHHMYQANFLRKPSRLEQLQVDWKRMGS